MSIEVVKVDSPSKLKRFINVPWKIYKKDPMWIPPLRMAVHDLFKPTHPFYETGIMQSWLALEDGEEVGRISAVNCHAYNRYHEEKTGFFGFFEAKNKEVTDILFNTAESWLKSQGLDTVQGPFSPTTNYECGLLVDGFDDPPQIMMQYNPKEYVTNIESLGYAKAKDLLAYVIPTKFEMPEVIKKIAARTESRSKITYRSISKKTWERDVNQMLDIYNSAWEKNWGFIPMTEAEFRHTAKDLKSVVDEKLIIFADVDGDPAGFIVTLPDFNQVLKKIKNGRLLPFGIFKLLMNMNKVNRCRTITLGVKAKYRNLGLGPLLYQKSHQTLLEQGKYHEIEMSWVLEDNLDMNKPIIRMGGKPYKRYRIFEKSLQ